MDRLSCCGIAEFSGLCSNPELVLREVAESTEWCGLSDYSYTEFNGCYVIFSDTTPSKNLTKLVKYIRKYNLGTLASLPAKKNPNSGNMIKVVLWSINQTNFKRWCKER